MIKESGLKQDRPTDLVGRSRSVRTNELKFDFSFYTILFLTLFAGCSSEQITKSPPIGPQVVTTDIKVDRAPQVKEIKAPWDISDNEGEELTELFRENKIKEALSLLLEQKKSAQSLQVYTNLASLFLKLGKANEALSTISEFVNLNHLRIEDIPGQLKLIAAYAYKNQKDIDQTFAWFSAAIRSSSPEVSAVAKSEVRNLLSRVSDGVFNEYFTKWEKDQSLSLLIQEEQFRRRGGGVVVRIEEPDYFSPAYYGYLDKETAIGPALDTQESGTEVAVLVPQNETREIESQEKAIGMALGSSIPPYRFRKIHSLLTTPSTPPKIIINLSSKSPEMGELVKDVIIFFVNPKIANDDYSVSAKPSEEVMALIKAADDSQCKEIFAVIDQPISLPSTINRVTIEEMLSITAVSSGGHSQCLIGSFEVEAQVENLATIKSRWPELKLFGRSTWVDPVLLQTYHKIFDGAVFITPFYTGSSRAVVREFLTSFQNIAGKEGTYSAALAYDVGKISALILGHKQAEGASYRLQSVTGIASFAVITDRATGVKRVVVTERGFTRLFLKDGYLEEFSEY